jgi:hypothetical protein
LTDQKLVVDDRLDFSVDLEPGLETPELAARVLALADQTRQWVRRRVESVVFEDEKTVRRSVSVDFGLPKEAPRLTLGGDRIVRIVPLARLQKERPLVGFDLFDESGASIPLLTATQAQIIVANGLIRMARERIHNNAAQSLDSELEKDIWDVATCEEEDAEKARKRIVEDPKGDPARTTLAQDDRVQTLLWRYARSFLLLVALEDNKPHRRVIKFRYVEPFRGAGGPLKLLIGEPHHARFDVPGAQEGGYHLEIDLPKGVRVINAFVDTRDIAIEEEGEAKPVTDCQIIGSKVHLCVRSFPFNAMRAVAKADLRSARMGWLGGACLCAWLIALVLVVGSIWLRWQDNVAPSFNTAVTLLLVIPGIFATLMVRQAEHPMVAYLLRAVRTLLIASSLLTFAAAGTLVMATSQSQLRTYWAVYAVVATVLAVMITAAEFTPAMKLHRGRFLLIISGLLISACTAKYLFSDHMSHTTRTSLLVSICVAVVCVVGAFAFELFARRPVKRGDSR